MFTLNTYETPIEISTTVVAIESERLSVPVAIIAVEPIFLPTLLLYRHI